MKTEGKPIFQLGLCGDWVEIRKTIPVPKDEGKFSLVFRKKWKRDCLPLFTGITKAGIKSMIKQFKSSSYDSTNLLLLIGDKLRQLKGLQKAKFSPV